MPNPYFSFKQFTVYHDKCGMKVGIDGVLLGAWASTLHTTSILDIGTGSGLIALMLAQRTNAKVIGIDIDGAAVEQAKQNVRDSPWSDNVEIVNISLQEFAKVTTSRFDLIVSNPPYFVNSLKAPMQIRNAARHTDTLSHSDLIDIAAKILTPDGRICLILPINEGLNCIDYAQSKGLFCHKYVSVFPKPGVEPKRLLLEFVLFESPKITSELTIESDVRHHYSTEFTELARDFYLKL